MLLLRHSLRLDDSRSLGRLIICEAYFNIVVAFQYQFTLVERNAECEGVDRRYFDPVIFLFMMVHNPRRYIVAEYCAGKIIRCPVFILIDPGNKSECDRDVGQRF